MAWSNATERNAKGGVQRVGCYHGDAVGADHCVSIECRVCRGLLGGGMELRWFQLDGFGSRARTREGRRPRILTVSFRRFRARGAARLHPVSEIRVIARFLAIECVRAASPGSPTLLHHEMSRHERDELCSSERASACRRGSHAVAEWSRWS